MKFEKLAPKMTDQIQATYRSKEVSEIEDLSDFPKKSLEEKF